MEWTCSRCSAWGDATRTVLLDVGWKSLDSGIVCPRCVRQLGLDPAETPAARERAVTARLLATRSLWRGSEAPPAPAAAPPVAAATVVEPAEEA